MGKGINFVYTPILLDNEKDTELADKGYSIFPFLSPAEIMTFTRYYHETQKETPDHFYSSTHSTDISFRKKTNEFLKTVISPLLPQYFKDYRLLGGAFVVKPPNGKGLLPPHQDWNIVNEQKARSYNLWIPLMDVKVENGAVFVLEGSHRKMNTYRGPGIPSILRDVESHVWGNMNALPMLAGEALFYDHALIHGSPANQSEHIRLGVVCGMISRNERMQLCFNSQNGVSIYEATEDFFLQKDPMEGPQDLKFIRELYPEYSLLSEEQFKSIFLGENQSSKKTWFAKLLQGK